MSDSKVKDHSDTEMILRVLREAGEKMTAKDHREQTIAYVLASAGLGPEDRKEVEHSIDKLYGTGTKP